MVPGEGRSRAFKYPTSSLIAGDHQSVFFAGFNLQTESLSVAIGEAHAPCTDTRDRKTYNPLYICLSLFHTPVHTSFVPLHHVRNARLTVVTDRHRKDTAKDPYAPWLHAVRRSLPRQNPRARETPPQVLPAPRRQPGLPHRPARAQTRRYPGRRTGIGISIGISPSSRRVAEES